MSPEEARKFLKQFKAPKAKPTIESEALRKLANTPIPDEDPVEDSAPVKFKETKVFMPDPERKRLPIETKRIRLSDEK